MGRPYDPFSGIVTALAVFALLAGSIGALLMYLWLLITDKVRAKVPAPLPTPGYSAGAAYDSGLAMDELHRVEEMIRRELLVEAFDDATYGKLMEMRLHSDTLDAQNSLTEQGESK